VQSVAAGGWLRSKPADLGEFGGQDVTIPLGKITPASGSWANHFDVTDADIDWFGLIASAGKTAQGVVTGDGLPEHLTVNLSSPGTALNGIVQNAGPDPSTVSGTITDNGTSYAVSLHRTDGLAIDPTQATWIIIHGWDSSPSSFTDMVSAIHGQRPGDQILVLDWSAAANTGIFDPGDAEARVPLVAAWAAGALSGLGFSGSNINEIGHSFGAYVAEEIAERISGGVNTIVALDPAVDVATRGYHPDAPGEVNFAAVSQFSWAFHDSDSATLNLSTLDGLGSSITSQTADDAIDVANSNHTEIPTLFTYLISHPNDTVGQDFTLQRLLNHTAGPWLPNQFDSNGASSAGSEFEGVMTAASGGVTPQSINFVPNATSEIAVSGSGVDIADDDTTPSGADLTDFGSTLQGSAAIQHSFRVTNSGSGTLTSSGLTLPAGFSLVEGLSSSIAPGGSDSFTIQLDTTSVGTKSGQISFANNDNNESPFNFSITGVVQLVGIVIESKGSTSLVGVVNNYFLYANGTTTGPELKYGGTPYVAAAWAPIGAEQTSTGYEVALFNASSQLYTVWNTDSSGNVLSASISGVSGTNTALESIETSFQQDLNGDGTIGIPVATGTTIEAFGATKLVQVGNDYFFNPVAGGSGPELLYSGTPWAAGQAWAPIGVEKTSTGYEVALFNASSHLYTIWNTDSSGNVQSAPISGVAGTNTALESIETSFQQDLNGDGAVGIPGSAGIIEAFGATKLVQVGNDYFFNPVAGGTGPELTYGGTPYVAAAWAPIGVEKTSAGYEVALFNASSQLYTIWNTDSSGNVLSSSLSGVSGTNTALESIETSFQQDLNGDHVIGPPSHTAAAAPIAAPSSGNAVLPGSAASDTFVFNPHFGNDTLKGFQPGMDQVDLAHTLFASVAELLTHTADSFVGSAVVTIGADQSITFDGVSKLLLQHHASDFHLL
jgi:pimeloyl-ACP methyl ester carboxylesterase